MAESLESIHQRLAGRIREIEGVFGVFLGDGTGLQVLLRQGLESVHAMAKRQVLALVDELAQGTRVNFEVTEQEFPTGGLAPGELPD